jgi:histidine triad (HIT) family protein
MYIEEGSRGLNNQHQIFYRMAHSDPNCLFCKIVGGDIPADIVYRNEYVLAFRDINPAAREHLLIIPLKHIASLNDLEGEEDIRIAGEIMRAAKVVAQKAGIEGSGYRLVFNTGPDSLQSVFHIHGHLIGGERMGWPPFPGKPVGHG